MIYRSVSQSRYRADSVNIPPRVFMESAMDQFEVDNLKVTPLAVKRILYKDIPMEAELLKIGRKQKQILKQVRERHFAHSKLSQRSVNVL